MFDVDQFFCQKALLGELNSPARSGPMAFASHSLRGMLSPFGSQKKNLERCEV